MSVHNGLIWMHVGKSANPITRFDLIWFGLLRRGFGEVLTRLHWRFGEVSEMRQRGLADTSAKLRQDLSLTSMLHSERMWQVENFKKLFFPNSCYFIEKSFCRRELSTFQQSKLLIWKIIKISEMSWLKKTCFFKNANVSQLKQKLSRAAEDFEME